MVYDKGAEVSARTRIVERGGNERLLLYALLAVAVACTIWEVSTPDNGFWQHRNNIPEITCVICGKPPIVYGLIPLCEEHSLELFG